MPCNKPEDVNWNEFCAEGHSECVTCRHGGGPIVITPQGTTGDPNERRVITLIERIKREMEILKERLADDYRQLTERLAAAGPIERSMELAQFYGANGLLTLRAMELDAARIVALRLADGTRPELRGNQTNAAQLALLTADALRIAEFHEAAVETYRYVPLRLSQLDEDSVALIGRALRNKGRSLDMLGRTTEAEANFALSDQLLSLRGSRG